MTTGAEYWEAKYNELVAQTDALMDTIRAGKMTDGHHTHNELYEYRMLYNAALFNEWYFHRQYDVHKSLRHHTGEYCFGTVDEQAGWFIVVATLPQGQISNHYKLEHWYRFRIPERELPVAYDGHEPWEAAKRLREFLREPPPETCRAQRWSAEPCYVGDHVGHFFHYGKDGEYQGYCGGWPKRTEIKF